VAALVRTVYPTLTPAQVMGRLRATARDAGPRGIDPYYGYGMLDAYYAVGGGWGTEFPQRALGAGEPNDVPARAAAFSTSVTGTIAMEGDVDWYRYESTGQKTVEFRVTPPVYDVDRAQNFDPILAVYDKDLRLIGEVDSVDPTVAERLVVTLAAGTYYVAIRSYNGAADTRSYTLAIGTSSASPFNPAQATTVGSWPETVVVGDVTGDGRDDVLLATSSYFDEANDYKLFVYAQNADGSLAAPARYPTRLAYADHQGAGLALLDADGDGRLDVALATDAGVQIFRQTATGALEDAGILPQTTGARHVVAADMDADNDADLVMSRAPSFCSPTSRRVPSCRRL
jgi:serine protease